MLLGDEMWLEVWRVVDGASFIKTEDVDDTTRLGCAKRLFMCFACEGEEVLMICMHRHPSPRENR
jgi:hypothetical protein